MKFESEMYMTSAGNVTMIICMSMYNNEHVSAHNYVEAINRDDACSL